MKTIFRVDNPIGNKNWGRSPSRGESARWRTFVAETERRLNGTHAIHVMDREGDSSTLSALHEHEWLFVIRSCHDRRLVDRDVNVWDTAREAAHVVECEVAARPTEDGRSERETTSSAPSETRDLRSPPLPSSFRARRRRRKQRDKKIIVVHVIEIDTPRGEMPVEWILVTNLFDVDRRRNRIRRRQLPHPLAH